MKIRLLSLITLALVCVLAVPAHAQQQSITVQFRLTVNVECAGAAYFGLSVPNSSDAFSVVELTDADGDGVFTGTAGFSEAPPLGFQAQLIQGTEGTRIPEGEFGAGLLVPGQPSRVLKSLVTAAGDVAEGSTVVLEGTVSDCITNLPPTGARDSLPTMTVVAALLLLVAGAYVQRRMWRAA